MPSTTSYRSGSDFRAYVRDAIAARENVAAKPPSPLVRLRRAFQRRIAGELAFCRDVGAAATARAGLRRVSQPGKQEPTFEMTEAEWTSELAREYRDDYLPVRPERDISAEAPEKSRGHADPAGAFLLRAGHALWRFVTFFRPLARLASAWSGPLAKLAVMGIALLAGADLLTQWRETSRFREAPAPAVSRGAWLDIARPYQLYDLPAPQLSHESHAYAAHRHATGGGREDTLTFGRFAAEKRPFLRLSVYRHGAEERVDAPFFVAMARRAAQLGLSVSDVRLEQGQPTQFGEMEQAPLTLSDSKGSRQNCRGFRLIRAEPGLTLDGLACAAGSETMSAPSLACLLDRLELLSAGSDKPLRDFFGAAEARNVQACAETGRRR